MSDGLVLNGSPRMRTITSAFVDTKFAAICVTSIGPGKEKKEITFSRVIICGVTLNEYLVGFLAFDARVFSRLFETTHVSFSRH